MGASAENRNREGPGARTRAHCLRRARVRSRCVYPGADSEPDARPAAGERNNVSIYFPRPLGRQVRFRYDNRYVSRSHSRALPQREAVWETISSLYASVALGGLHSQSGSSKVEDNLKRGDPFADWHGRELSFCRTLRSRQASLPGKRARTRGNRGRAFCRVF